MARRSRTLSMPNLHDVPDEGGSFLIPEGEYEMELISVEESKSKASNEDMFTWVFEGADGKAKGKKFYMHTTLQDNGLWKLKQTLKALDVDIPDSKFDVDPDDLIGKSCVGMVVTTEYQGRERSSLDRILPGGGGEDDRERGREDRSGGRERGKSAKGNGDLPKLEAEDINGMDEGELEDLVDKYGVKIDLSKSNTINRKRSAVLAKMESAGHIA